MPILAKLREYLEHEKVPYSVHSHPAAYPNQQPHHLRASGSGRGPGRPHQVSEGDDKPGWHGEDVPATSGRNDPDWGFDPRGRPSRVLGPELP